MNDLLFLLYYCNWGNPNFNPSYWYWNCSLIPVKPVKILVWFYGLKPVVLHFDLILVHYPFKLLNRVLRYVLGLLEKLNRKLLECYSGRALSEEGLDLQLTLKKTVQYAFFFGISLYGGFIFISPAWLTCDL